MGEPLKVVGKMRTQELHQTYKPEQRNWLMDLNSFIGLVRTKQERF